MRSSLTEALPDGGDVRDDVLALDAERAAEEKRLGDEQKGLAVTSKKNRPQKPPSSTGTLFD